MIFFLPHHLCRLLGIRLSTYLYSTFTLAIALCVPLVAVLLLMQHWFVPHRFGQLLIQLLIAGVVYGMGLAWAFWTHRAWDVGQLGGNQENDVTLALVETYREEA